MKLSTDELTQDSDDSSAQRTLRASDLNGVQPVFNKTAFQASLSLPNAFI